MAASPEEVGDYECLSPCFTLFLKETLLTPELIL
jgi:hypothetical protein